MKNDNYFNTSNIFYFIILLKYYLKIINCLSDFAIKISLNVQVRLYTITNVTNWAKERNLCSVLKK